MEHGCGSLPGLIQVGGNADVLHATGVGWMAQRCEPFACWTSSLVCGTDHGDEGVYGTYGDVGTERAAAG